MVGPKISTDVLFLTADLSRWSQQQLISTDELNRFVGKLIDCMISLPSQPQPPSPQTPYHTTCGLIGICTEPMVCQFFWLVVKNGLADSPPTPKPIFCYSWGPTDLIFLGYLCGFVGWGIALLNTYSEPEFYRHRIGSEDDQQDILHETVFPWICL